MLGCCIFKMCIVMSIRSHFPEKYKALWMSVKLMFHGTNKVWANQITEYAKYPKQVVALKLKSIRRNWLHPRKRGIRPQFARSTVSQKCPLHNKTFESRHFSSVKQQIRPYHYSALLWSMSTTGNGTNFALLSRGQMGQWRVKNAPVAFH